MPVWVSWSSSRTSCLPGGGITTRDPRRMQPSRTLNSSRSETYGWNSVADLGGGGGGVRGGANEPPFEADNSDFAVKVF